MNNAFSRIVRTCAYAVIGGGLMAGALLAGNLNEINVTLPYAVAIGATTLPSGHYTLSSFEMGGSDEYFIVRNEKGVALATIEAQPVQSTASKTQVVLSNDSGAWRLNRLDVAGSVNSYEFLNK